MKHENVKKMAMLALLAALVAVLQTVASGIKIGPIPITLTLVPIVIGAVLYGPGAGAGLGLLFGVVTAVAGITGYDAGTQGLFVLSPFWTVATCLIKGTACGWAAGMVYRAFHRKNTLACLIAALCAPVVNTGIFALAMMTVMRGALVAFAGGTDVVYYLFIIVIGVNFLVELGINAVLSTAIARIVQVIGKK